MTSEKKVRYTWLFSKDLDNLEGILNEREFEVEKVRKRVLKPGKPGVEKELDHLEVKPDNLSVQYHPKKAMLRPEGDSLSEKDKELHRLTMGKYPHRFSAGEALALGGGTAFLGGVGGLAYTLLTLG